MAQQIEAKTERVVEFFAAVNELEASRLKVADFLGTKGGTLFFGDLIISPMGDLKLSAKRILSWPIRNGFPYLDHESGECNQVDTDHPFQSHVTLVHFSESGYPELTFESGRYTAPYNRSIGGCPEARWQLSVPHDLLSQVRVAPIPHIDSQP